MELLPFLSFIVFDKISSETRATAGILLDLDFFGINVRNQTIPEWEKRPIEHLHTDQYVYFRINW